MAKGWAVGGAVTLALVVATVETPARPTTEVASWIRLGVLVAAYACWAYALAVAAYGDKGALAALVAYEIGLAALVGATRVVDDRMVAGAIVVALVSAFVTFLELRGRRGPIRWGTAAALALPLVLAVPMALR